MSSISGISSGIGSFQPSSGSSPLTAIKKDLNSLQSALESGDLDAAKSAFSSLQTDFKNLPKPPGGDSTSSSTSSSSSNPIQKDLAAVQSALASGDTDAAKSAFTQLKSDLQSLKPHHGHHGKPPVNDSGITDRTSSNTSSSSDLTNTFLDAIKSTTLTSSSASVDLLA